MSDVHKYDIMTDLGKPAVHRTHLKQWQANMYVLQAVCGTAIMCCAKLHVASMQNTILVLPTCISVSPAEKL